LTRASRLGLAPFSATIWSGIFDLGYKAGDGEQKTISIVVSKPEPNDAAMTRAKSLRPAGRVNAHG
jgi:hypothetical protein